MQMSTVPDKFRTAEGFAPRWAKSSTGMIHAASCGAARRTTPISDEQAAIRLASGFRFHSCAQEFAEAVAS